MIDQDDELEHDDELDAQNKASRKKMLIFVLPVVIVIGLSVGFYYVFNRDYNSSEASYSIVKKGSSSDGNESITVFYDLPDINANLHSVGPDKENLRIGINLELSNVEDIKNIETLTPKINDVILSHIIELHPDEVSGSNGLYWLKEELLYRINLVVAPIKINNLNIRSLDIEKQTTKDK